jgi:hypothetical protein
MPFTLNLSPEVLSTGGSRAARIIPSEDDPIVKNNLALADSQIPQKYQFDEEGCGVSCRAYVTRLVTAKLAGTGVMAAIAAHATTKPRFPWTCGLAAAVNFIAVVHYAIITLVRSQILPQKYQIWTIGVGRDEENKQSRKSALQASIYVQELMVDGLRFSDWLATLVLMTLALGSDRNHILAEIKDTTTKPVSEWWLAVAQVAMVTCGSFWRFYTNEGRSEGCSRVLAAFAFTLGCGIFIFICVELLRGLGPALSRTDETAMDAQVIFALVLVWCGYPLTYMWTFVVNWGVPLQEYSSRASLGKDVAFGTLDVTSKGGLALYSAYRALM